MTRAERKQVKQVWAELENIITVIDPQMNLRQYLKPEELDREDLNGIDTLISIIRVYVKYLKLEIESLKREETFLMMMLNGGGNVA
ncbi:MAG: hypothetical protein ACTSUO_08505 [Candidatus Thorarchaeota archaeon]